jgi:hypothetical protein
VGGFDLLYKDGKVEFDANCMHTAYLGCANNRSEQLPRLRARNERRRAEKRKASLAAAEEEKQKKNADAAARKPASIGASTGRRTFV